MARGTFFKMRLLDEEKAELEARARQIGPKAKMADVVRRALGWDEAPTVAAGQPHPESEPGAAALEKLTQRLKKGT